MNVIFYTLGCKVNQYETEAIKEGFLKKGHTCNSQISADAVIVNSCTVTAESDRKTRQAVRRLKRENPNSVVILTGCMVQAFPEEAKNLTEADIVTGNKDISKIIELAEEYSGNRIFDFSAHNSGDPYNTPAITDFDEHTRAFMKIEDGCDRFCTYCIIPFSRGRVRSRSCEEIKEEAERLAESGYSEIVLVGINLSSYGKNEDFDLCDAVETVCSVEKIKRVRLGSIEPDLITDEMLIRFKNQSKFCPQFHLSLQSGCDETLKRMNRHYDTAFYSDLVLRIRNIFPDAAITTDIMVGFAGESDEEFEKSLEFVKKMGFARSHIFIYSRRTGTVAAALKNQMPQKTKEERARRMRDAACSSEEEFLKSQTGKTYPVLFEKCENGICEGYTPNYTKVYANSSLMLTGKIIQTKIISAEKDKCLGRIEVS